MKRLAVILGVMAVTALVTYLLVADHFRREQVNTLRRELAQVQTDLTRLQDDLARAQNDLSAREVPRLRFEPRTNNSASKPAITKTPPVTAGATAENTSVSQNQVTTVGVIPAVPVVPAIVPAGGSTIFTSSPGSVCRVQGTTRQGQRWELVGNVIGGSLDLDTRLRLNASATSNLRVLGSNIAASALVVIPVRTLRSQLSPGGPRMDQQLQAAMESSRYPRITFQLGQLILHESTNSAAHQFSSQGMLEMHGRKNRINLPVSIAEHSANKLKVTGSTALRMTDFGIAPQPVPLPGGSDVAEDEVAVSFEWIVQHSDTAPLTISGQAP